MTKIQNHSLYYIFLLVIAFTHSTINCEKIKVHVIPHSHDDVGWLRTMDSYFYQVNNILNNMVKYLSERADRTFVYCEMAFFEKWWVTQSDETKQIVKKFVEDGRIEFVNGGWVMNDEACATDQDIIDQMRLGMMFLEKEFNYRPKTAWYLDPFGHSKTNAAVMSRLGFNNLVMVRIDEKEKEIRKNKKEMEFIWKPYYEIDNGDSKIFTHITYNHYSPKGLLKNFLSTNLNIRYSSENDQTYFNYFKEMADVYRTNNLLFLYGDDFTYDNDAWHLWSNMDNLIDYFNKAPEWKDKFEIFYSTPQKYFGEISNTNNVDWPQLKNYDFFPYSDDPNTYWVGYFTSRPYLKGLVRDAGKYLYQSSLFILNQLFINNNKNLNFETEIYPQLNQLRRGLGVLQHHDGVSGTARELVSEDYATMMEKPINLLKQTIIKVSGLDPNFSLCIPSASEINCQENAKYNLDKDLYLVLLTYDIETVYPVNIKLPNTINKNEIINVYKVRFDNTENQVITEVKSDFYCMDDAEKVENCHINFLNDFSVNKKEKSPITVFKISKETLPNNEERNNNVNKFIDDGVSFVEIYENNSIKVSFNINQGFKYFTKNDNIEYTVKINYSTFDTNGFWKRHNSGAYIMSPQTEYPNISNLKIENSYYFNGEYVFVANIQFEFAVLRLIVYKHIEFNFLVKSETHMFPMPTGVNKEYLISIQSDINNNSSQFGNLECFTDTNTSLMSRRVKNFRPNWDLKRDELTADNFYPVNSFIAINDNGNQKKILAVWNDRSQAGASITQGEILLNVNRVSTQDDNRGLADGIYEKITQLNPLVYTHYISFGKNFNEKKIYSYVNQHPMIMSNNEIPNYKNLMNIINNKNELNLEYFITHGEYSSDCLKADYFILDENSFLLQITNKFTEPVFDKEFKARTCSFKFIEDNITKFTVMEMHLNGIDKLLENSNHKTKNLRNYAAPRESGSVESSNYELRSYDMLTFLFKKI
jgi:lysosomal alpha-mannosidase